MNSLSPQESQGEFWRARIAETAASWKQMFSGKTIASDIAAGLTVACVALPLNLALAIASGVPAGVGVVTAVVAGTVAGLLGGSRLQVTGPAAAMIPLVYEIIQRHGIKGLIVAGFICGLAQIGLGLARVGGLVQSIPVSVVTGFMSGIGVLILGGQIPRLLGLPASFKSVTYMARGGTSWVSQINWTSVVIGLGVLAAMVLIPKIHKRIPAALVALVVVTAIAGFLGLSVQMVGAIPRGIPTPALPDFLGVDMVKLLPEAFAMTVLASAESLLSAVVVDSMAKTPRHSSDQELVGQGFANLTSSLFGGLPVTGVIVRSSVAVQSGGRTRLAPVSHSAALLIMMLAAAPLVAKVPIAALAGILLFVGLRLVEWHQLYATWKISRFEAGIFAATMLGIVFTDFIDGVMIGLALALVNFARTQRQLGVKFTLQADEPGETAKLLSGRNDDPLDLAVVRVEGPIFFASHTQLEGLATKKTLPNYIVFDLAGVPLIDMTGLETFRALIKTLADRNVKVLVARAQPAVNERLERAGILDLALGKTMYGSVSRCLTAVAAAEESDESAASNAARTSSDAPPATATA